MVHLERPRIPTGCTPPCVALRFFGDGRKHDAPRRFRDAGEPVVGRPEHGLPLGLVWDENTHSVLQLAPRFSETLIPALPIAPQDHGGVGDLLHRLGPFLRPQVLPSQHRVGDEEAHGDESGLQYWDPGKDDRDEVSPDDTEAIPGHGVQAADDHLRDKLLDGVIVSGHPHVPEAHEEPEPHRDVGRLPIPPGRVKRQHHRHGDLERESAGHDRLDSPGDLARG